MTVRILLFASLAERLGVRELSLELAGGATVADALDALDAKFESLSAMRDRIALAVNHAYVQGDHVLAAGDELALIPPISGG